MTHQHALSGTSSSRGQGTFANTGPQGHRGRMRGRLLANEAALADYEILEMLLFLGIPRRDTKPLAKSLINSFGSLGATLSAAVSRPGELGLPAAAAAALALVTDSARHLAGPDAMRRPVLDSWAALTRHLDLKRRMDEPARVSALLLNSRNQLIGEPDWAADVDRAGLPRAVLRQALEQHASAVLVVRHGRVRPAILEADLVLHAAMVRAAEPLSVAVHDLVVTGLGQWVSLLQTSAG